MPVVGANSRPAVALGRVTSPRGLAFLPTAVQGRQPESAEVGFNRPVVTAVVYTGPAGISFSGQLLAIGPTLARIITRVLLPRTVGGRAIQSLTLNAILDEVLGALDDNAFGAIGFTQARQFAIKAATRFWRAYLHKTDDNNVSVVFFPESQPELDLLKWDP